MPNILCRAITSLNAMRFVEPTKPSFKPKPDFRVERKLQKRGLSFIAGVDEAGRGPLAGPVSAAAVVLNPKDLPEGLNDSKLLSPEVRDILYIEIMQKALAVSVAFSSAAEIDRINIRLATHAAMRRALWSLSLAPQFILIDGNDLPIDLPCEGEAIVKGDELSLTVAAASIIAKVTRDRLMRRLCQHFPGYGFKHHFGYATKNHLKAISLLGPCPYHRLTFSPFKTPITTLAR
jgi:ribonuclease HII